MVEGEAHQQHKERCRVTDLIRQLSLSPLEGESGLYRLVNRSTISVQHDGYATKASNAIYYALNAARPQNNLHWLESDDYHIRIVGGAADYYIFHPDGSSESKRLGLNVDQGESPMIVIPGGCWKAIRLVDLESPLLVGSVVTPTWRPEGVEIGADAEFIKKYSGSSPWATDSFLRQLVGPNVR